EEMKNPNPLSSSQRIITIERHILQTERLYPQATGSLTNLLYDLALAGKYIASKTTRAGLAQILGRTGQTNVQGEKIAKLDELADQVIYDLMDHTGRLAIMASEEHEAPLPIPEEYPTGDYVLLFDPLDGSSNIDFNVSVGTIFAIHHRLTTHGRGTIEDILQPGRTMIAAGYIVYGASTMLVYSTGHGVDGFTLDPDIGEFLLTHPNIKIPEPPQYFSANQGYQSLWSQADIDYTHWLQGIDTSDHQALSARYVGSLVTDFHRNLLAGGVYYYPADRHHPHGKLRLLYEAAPLAFIAEQAGGLASDGRRNILDIQPHEIHQRTPLYIGNCSLVKKAETFRNT
ncbi:MAG: class 1 fructose-bisphosphatase, partial [Anaerolineaceae bacterium]|nr:class 1 fructose-bisphosphatase [Anaerolineaceae bacterium]